MVQARAVAARLAQRGIATTFLTLTTTGDAVTDRAVSAMDAQNVWVKELELALRDGRAQYAVHSCKDLPSELPGDMLLAAVSSREDPRDVFCSETYATFADLPPGARVGTSSTRRKAQLAALRQDVRYVDLRGNVDTRLRKLREGQYDGLVLAAAGLHRLGAAARYTVPFAIDEMVPATGQGALAIEMLRGDERVRNAVRSAINDDAAERAISCERAALRALRGGCQAPIGIHASYDDTQLVAGGAVAAPDGSRVIRARAATRVDDVARAQALGERLADDLRSQGAETILGTQVL